MTLSLQNQRDKTRRALGLDETDTLGSNTEIDLLLNTSWWEIADVFKFREKQTSRQFNTVVGTITYAVSADHNATQIIAIEDDDSDQHTPLKPISETEYESLFVDTTAARGKPTHYFRRGANIHLYPTPDAVYEMTEYYDKTLSDLASSGDATSIPQSWHELIWLGAAFRGFLELGDVNKAYAYRKLQGLPSLVETKEEVPVKERQNTQYAAVQVLRPRYP